MMKKWSLLLLFISLSFYGQNDTISFVKTSTIGVVSADKMNVVYRGLPNIISIAVPNCKSFIASGDGLYKSTEGKYQLIPASGIESIITLDIILNDGSIKKEEHKFRIKNLPRLSGAINGLSSCEQCIIEMTKEELKNAIISVDTKLSLYGLEIKDKVDSFDVEFSKKERILNFGNTFNEQTISKINTLKLGSIIIIDYIHWPNPIEVCRTSPVKIKIIIVEEDKKEQNEE